MPINFLHANWSDGAFDDLDSGQAAANYIEARNNYIKLRENATLAAGGTTQGAQNIRNIHDGGADGNPTIGYGFNLAALGNTYAKIESYLTHAFGGALTQLQQDGLAIIQGWKAQSNGLTNADIIAIAQGKSSVPIEFVVQKDRSLQGI